MSGVLMNTLTGVHFGRKMRQQGRGLATHPPSYAEVGKCGHLTLYPWLPLSIA